MMTNANDIMQGFDPAFRDPAHYIRDITQRIWEGRGLPLIRDWYAGDCPVRTPLSETRDVDTVITGTAATLAAFPDRELLAEDIILAPRSPGFYSSHRIFSPMTHLGPGSFGPPTGRSVRVRTIADCLCRDNRIVEEWLVRDQGAIARHLGLDLPSLALSLLRPGPDGGAPGPDALIARWTEPGAPIQFGDTAPLAPLLEALTQFWQEADFSQVTRLYDRAASVCAPGGEEWIGYRAIEAGWFGWLAALPRGRLRLHHGICRNDSGQPLRVALRWSYQATHSNGGRFGSASHRPVVLLGLTHWEIIDGRVHRDWTLIDELSVYAQILAPQSAG
jgi:predicted ester cyclase